MLIVLAVAGAGAAHALPPSVVLGAYGESGDSSLSPSSGTPYADVKLQGTFGWRQALAPGSYAAISSSASIAPYVASLSGYVDTEFLNLELGLPAGADSLIFDAGGDSSIVNQTGVGGYARPSWSAEYRLRRNEAGLQPSLAYLGSYLTEELGSDDHLSQSLQLRLSRSTDVRLETYGGLRGGWELWTKQQAYDSSGKVAGPYRQDWVLGLNAGARGFAGFSVDWSADASAGVRFSDADTTSTAVSQLVLPGGSRLTGMVKAGASWTPSRFLSMSLKGSAQDDWYLARDGMNADGTFSAQRMNVLALGANLRADWTPDNSFYVVFQAGVTRVFANDPSVDEWAGLLSAGVEYSF